MNNRLIDLGFAVVDWLHTAKVDMATCVCLIWAFVAGYVIGKIKK